MTSLTDLSVDNMNVLNTLNVDGVCNFKDEVYALKQLVVNSNTIIKGNLNTYSNVNISGNTILRGNMYALSGINVNGLCNLQGDINVKGNLHVSGTTTIPTLKVGNINNIEDTVNNKIDLEKLDEYYNITETSNLFLPEFNLNNLSVNGILKVGNINNIEDIVNNKINMEKLNEYYNMTETSNLFLPEFNLNNLSVNGILKVGSIFNIEDTINQKATYTMLSNFYTKPEIDQKIVNTNNNFKINDINLNNTMTNCDMFINGYIRLSNKNTSTLILPSAFEFINLYNLKPNTTFITSISQVLGPLAVLYMQPTNIDNSITYISLGPNQYTNDITTIATAPGFQNNYFTHHFITRIDTFNSMTVFKM
jgi:hypothetical protein